MWRYYARPASGASTSSRVARHRGRAGAQARARPAARAFEWVHETTPTLLPAALDAGLEVLEVPLLVLDRSRLAGAGAAGGHHAARAGRRRPRRSRAAPRGPARRLRRRRDRARPAGPRRAQRASSRRADFLRERLRRRATVTVVAEGEYGPVARASTARGRRDRDRRRRHAADRPPAGPRRGGHRRAGRGRAGRAAPRRCSCPRAVTPIARVYARLGFKRVGTACIVG